MKIISLNTWMGIVPKPLLQFFKTYQDTDIFCLQEIYKGAISKAEPHPQFTIQLDLFEQIHAQIGVTHLGYFRPAYKDYYGQAIFIKKGREVIEEGDIVIFDNAGNKIRGTHGRNLHYLRTRHHGAPLLIANVHGLWNGQGKTDTEERLLQSQQIHDFLCRKQEPTILVGDFNLEPNTKSLAIVEDGMRNLVKEYGITSTRTSYYKKDCKFADYALVTPTIRVRDFRVLPDEVSDHAALFLEIE